MLTRSIDIDPFDLTIEEKIFRGAQRICIFFAAAAVTLATLDILNIRSVENASAFVSENRQQVATLPSRLRTGIELITFTEESPTAVIAIPRDTFAIAANSGNTAIKASYSPVAELSAARHQDAVEFAMEAPSFAAKSQQRLAADPIAAFASQPFKLASADTGTLPDTMAPTLSQPMSTALTLDMVPMPRPAPGVPPPSPAERLHLTGAARVKAERCLANAIYFEARSEPVRGQMAVAQVVVNRAFSGFYPEDICGVVYQNASRHLACQFTFACDGKSKAINERGAWARANRIAKDTLDGRIYVPEVAKSTHYHAIYVHPNWVGEMKKMVRYGIHNFYRPYAWGNGAEEPSWGTAGMAQNKKN